MAISERVSPDNLNIHQFQEAPEGRPELPFEERDISAAQKENIEGTIIRSLNKISWDPVVYLLPARSHKLMWPHEPVPGTTLSPELLEDVKQLLLPQTDRIHFNYYLACLKIVHPELKIEGDASKLKKLESAEASLAEIYDFLENASNLKILNPDFSISDQEVAIAKKILEKIKSDDLISFLEFAANLRLLDSSYRPILTKKEWEQLKEHLSGIDDPAVEDFEGAAERMKILAAYKVEITAPGVIDIQMYPPDTINQPTPPMPETRKF